MSAIGAPSDNGFKTIYTFQVGTDAGGVQAKLSNVGGLLYGTSHGGGASGNGTVFTVNPNTGAEKVIYSFMGGADGWGPEAYLNVDTVRRTGELFGTTSNVPEPGYPDGQGNGTVFAISKTGVEKVLHGFTGSPDGANPEGFVTDVNGTLYGTTAAGGTGACTIGSATGCGTVFKIDPSTGTESVIYSFAGGTDGSFPRTGLLNVNGTLYGTTYSGGQSGSGCIGGSCGTVYSMTPAGVENVVYRFQGGADGANPQSALAIVNGVLYGTTNGGGTNGNGTVYSVTTTGTESVIYSACCGPEGGVIAWNGVLFGTTSGDGASSSGTVFSVTTTGSGKVLHQFTGGTNGGSPEDALLHYEGKLYGTTRLSGADGVGTVFKMSP
jgi:uncharacterized repeat protein (TIGR03803 family)